MFRRSCSAVLCLAALGITSLLDDYLFAGRHGGGRKQAKSALEPLRISFEGPMLRPGPRRHGIANANRDLMVSLRETMYAGNGHYLLLNVDRAALPHRNIVGNQNVSVTIRSTTEVNFAVPGMVPEKAWLRHGFVLPIDTSRFILQFPWEWGVIPTDWAMALKKCVDEIWTPSRFCKEAYVKSGVPSDRVHVIPHAINAPVFSRSVPKLPLPTNKSFKFLFSSVISLRKGIDILLRGYFKAFSARDDVTLIIQGAYPEDPKLWDPEIQALVNSSMSHSNVPQVIFLERLTDAEHTALFKSVDCYVLPYRGEGFSVTIFEAMLSGLPVITTGAGPAADYLDDSNAYLVRAERALCWKPPCSNRSSFAYGKLEWPTHEQPWWFEPSEAHLVSLLQTAHQDQAGRRARAIEGAKMCRRKLSFRKIGQIASDRLRAMPITRPVRLINRQFCMSDDDTKYQSIALFRELKGDQLFQRFVSSLNNTRGDQFESVSQKVMAGGLAKSVGLFAYPHSGISMTLNMLRAITGVYKHTLYGTECSRSLAMSCARSRQQSFAIIEKNDASGPGHMPRADEPIVVKSHGLHYGVGQYPYADDERLVSMLSQFAAIIRLIRNPLDQLFARRKHKRRTAKFITDELHRWMLWHRTLDTVAERLNIPILTLKYHDLQTQPDASMRKILAFIGFWGQVNKKSELIRSATLLWHDPSRDFASDVPFYASRFTAQQIRLVVSLLRKKQFRR